MAKNITANVFMDKMKNQQLEKNVIQNAQVLKLKGIIQLPKDFNYKSEIKKAIVNQNLK